eukprot:c23663_g1_i1 orf=575-1033(-)
MENTNLISGEKESLADAKIPAKPIRFTAEQRQELERLFRDCPRPSEARLQEYIDIRPALSNLERRHLQLWLQQRRRREKMENSLSPLISKNSEMKAQNQSLLLRNSQLRNQSLLLNLENRRLKEQLQQQLKYVGTVNSSSSTPAEDSNKLQS